MFNTFLHFAICAYQFKLGPCTVNRPCNINAVLGCPLLDFILIMRTGSYAPVRHKSALYSFK